MKQPTSHFRLILAIALATMASSFMSSVVVAADTNQNQPTRITPVTIARNLSLRVEKSNTSFIPQQTRSQGMTGWLQLRDQARSSEARQESVTCHHRVSDNQNRFCDVRWQQHNALSGSRKRFDRHSFDADSGLAKHLMNHLEIDIDRSPSIKLRYDFY